MGTEGNIRKKLLEEDLVETVIGLAPNLFYGTGVAASILIINKNKSALKKGKLLIIDGSEHFWKGKEQNEMHDKHVDHIFELYEAFDDIEGESKVVDNSELEKNDWNLNIPRYVIPVLKEDSTTLDEAVANLRDNLDAVWKDGERLKQLFGKYGLLSGDSQ